MKNQFERLSSDNLRYMLNSDSIVSTLGYKELLNEVLITREENEELQRRLDKSEHQLLDQIAITDRGENARLKAPWVDVDERTPTENDCIKDSSGNIVPYVLGCANGRLYGLIHLDYFDINTSYTHWAPLPLPPEERG